jgi:hypothetical protein
VLEGEAVSPQLQTSYSVRDIAQLLGMTRQAAWRRLVKVGLLEGPTPGAPRQRKPEIPLVRLLALAPELLGDRSPELAARLAALAKVAASGGVLEAPAPGRPRRGKAKPAGVPLVRLAELGPELVEHFRATAARGPGAPPEANAPAGEPRGEVREGRVSGRAPGVAPSR